MDADSASDTIVVARVTRPTQPTATPQLAPIAPSKRKRAASIGRSASRKRSKACHSHRDKSKAATVLTEESQNISEDTIAARVPSFTQDEGDPALNELRDTWRSLAEEDGLRVPAFQEGLHSEVVQLADERIAQADPKSQEYLHTLASDGFWDLSFYDVLGLFGSSCCLNFRFLDGLSALKEVYSTPEEAFQAVREKSHTRRGGGKKPKQAEWILLDIKRALIAGRASRYNANAGNLASIILDSTELRDVAEDSPSFRAQERTRQASMSADLSRAGKQGETGQVSSNHHKDDLPFVELSADDGKVSDPDDFMATLQITANKMVAWRETLEKRNADLVEENLNLAKMNAKLTESFEQTRYRLTEKCKEVQAIWGEKEGFSKQIEDLALEKEQLEKTSNDRKEQVERLEGRLRDRLKTLVERESKMRDLQKRNKQLEGELERQDGEVKVLEGRIAVKEAELLNKTREQERATSLCTTQVADLEQQIALRDNKIVAADDNNTSLRQELKEHAEDNGLLETEKTKLKTEKADLATQLRQQQADVQILAMDLAQVKAENQQLKDEDQLQRQGLEASRAENAKLVETQKAKSRTLVERQLAIDYARKQWNSALDAMSIEIYCEDSGTPRQQTALHTPMSTPRYDRLAQPSQPPQPPQPPPRQQRPASRNQIRSNSRLS